MWKDGHDVYSSNVQAQCRDLERELETCMTDHRRILEAVRTDTAQLLRENDSLVAEVAALRRGTAEMIHEREASDAEKDAVVRELMEIVQQQRTSLRQSKVHCPILQSCEP
jgi:regulator of replication initiation timing